VKKIVISFPGLMSGKLFDPDARDNCLQPFIQLRSQLRDLGYEFTTADSLNLTDCVGVWFWDAMDFQAYSSAAKSTSSKAWPLSMVARWTSDTKLPPLYKAARAAGLQSKTALFIGEPPSVCAVNSDIFIHELFPVVFTWSDRLVDDQRYRKFHYPQPETFPVVPDVPFSERKLIVNISGRKTSPHERELYSARLAMIRYLESVRPMDFDLFGPGWEAERPALTCYRGLVKHKWDIYPNYRFGLCFENIRDEDGYITEKIFDCMRAKCVPIYWGAGNITDYVDSAAFIDRRNFDSNQTLVDFLTGMGDEQYKSYRRAADAFLASERYACRFAASSFSRNVIEALSL
jgi:hypothetical protein